MTLQYKPSTKMLLVIIIILSLESCITYTLPLVNVESQKSITSDRVGFLSPLSSIYIIESKNKMMISEVLSIQSMETIKSVMSENFTDLGISRIASYEDEYIESKIQNEVFNYISYAHNNRKIDQIKLSKEMLQVLEENNFDYGIASYFSGFDRTAKNQKGQIAKAIGLGIATLGIFTVIPKKSNLTVHTMIFDRKNNRAVIYKEAATDGQKPNDANVIDKVLRKSIEKYFYN